MELFTGWLQFADLAAAPGFARARADQEVPKARAAPTGVGVAHKERPVSQPADGGRPGK